MQQSKNNKTTLPDLPSNKKAARERGQVLSDILDVASNRHATTPEIPIALKKKHIPTLIFKMPIEEQQHKNVGRYCIINPRKNNE